MLGVKMASIIQGYRSIFLKMYSLPGNLYPFDQPFNKNSCLGEVINSEIEKHCHCVETPQGNVSKVHLTQIVTRYDNYGLCVQKWKCKLTMM